MPSIASTKRFLKSFPMLVRIKTALWRSPAAAAAFLLSMLCLPFIKLRWLRRVRFDAAPRNSLLLSSVSPEVYVVSTNDRMIGRPTYAGGSFDLDKFEQTVRILGERRRNRLLVDVGANIGTICIPAVKRGIFEQAMAFEPEPFNFSLLSANILLNGLRDRIVAHNIALGSQNGQILDFELSEDNYGDHRILDTCANGTARRPRGRIIKVSSETLDQMLQVTAPDETLVWMDTQGFEGHILAGSTRTLQSQVPLVVEFWPHGMKRVASYQSLKDSLLAAGYRVLHDLNGPRMGEPVPLSSDALDSIYRRLGEDEWMFTDLLLR
jgi:FkbM family methyltransferase